MITFSELDELFRLRSQPCLNEIDGKECADLDLPVSDLCENCLNYWAFSAKINNETVEERIANA